MTPRGDFISLSSFYLGLASLSRLYFAFAGSRLICFSLSTYTVNASDCFRVDIFFRLISFDPINVRDTLGRGSRSLSSYFNIFSLRGHTFERPPGSLRQSFHACVLRGIQGLHFGGRAKRSTWYPRSAEGARFLGGFGEYSTGKFLISRVSETPFSVF